MNLNITNLIYIEFEPGSDIIGKPETIDGCRLVICFMSTILWTFERVQTLVSERVIITLWMDGWMDG